MLRAVFIGLIRFYRKAISPWTPAACRFQPTCSAYALEAVERYGAARGSLLAVRRLLRCHPWGGSGYDPVPLPPAEEPGGPETKGEEERTVNGESRNGPDGARKTKAMGSP